MAVILSAQCTDERVNQVTPNLFQQLPTLQSFIDAPFATVEKLVFSTGFYKNKAKSLKGFALMLNEQYGGVLPRTISELTRLPGIGRKTANVLLSEVYGIAEGFVVDTHVKRLSGRLGLTKHKDPVKIEKDLMAAVRQKYWNDLSLFFIFLGRANCKAHKTDCPGCVLADICPYPNQLD